MNDRPPATGRSSVIEALLIAGGTALVTGACKLVFDEIERRRKRKRKAEKAAAGEVQQ